MVDGGNIFSRQATNHLRPAAVPAASSEKDDSAIEWHLPYLFSGLDKLECGGSPIADRSMPANKGRKLDL